MDTDKHRFKHKEVTDKIIRVFYEVYNELGHGFLEDVLILDRENKDSTPPS